MALHSAPARTGPQSAGSACRGEKETILAGLPEKITIKPYFESSHNEPHILHPIRLIDRSQLPLSFLDTTPHQSFDFAASRLFTGCIPTLNALERKSASGATRYPVLVARLSPRSGLCVVEAVRTNVFTICKLAEWVTLDSFGVQQRLPKSLASLPEKHASTDRNAAWWTSLAVKRKAGDIEKTTGPVHKRLRISGFEVPRKPTVPVEQHALKSSKPTTSPCIPPTESIAKHATLPLQEQVFDTLVRQYLDAVYISRSSLAFFAKGPLSRARAAFSAVASPPSNSAELPAFLRSMILKVDLLSRKYREKLPSLVRALPPPPSHSDVEEMPASTKKRRKIKAPKLNKEGVYAMEEEVIKRWWHHSSETSERIDSQETAEMRLRRRIADLQTRETLAQIILILETLALETAALQGSAVAQTEEIPKLGEDALPAGKSKRKKKQQDLAMLLDLLMDKLSIWQSIEDTTFDGERKDKKPPAASGDPAQPADRDLLSQFCVEVVVPFFKSRLPAQATLVCQKLGGQAISPEKRTKRTNARSKSKEPEAKQKDASKRHRRPLQKTKSDTQLFGRPPSLVRSATDSFAIPRLKREASEISMSSIPFVDAPSRTSREPSVHMKHLSRRQVDINAIAAATEAKLKKKARVEEELREAISTLKKPNRTLTAKEFADISDQRKNKHMTGSRSQLSHARLALTDVQVNATPKHARKVDHFSQPVSHATYEDPIPASTPAVPSSVHRVNSMNGQSMTQPIFGSVRHDTIAATPSRRMQKAVNMFATPAKAGLPISNDQRIMNSVLSTTRLAHDFNDIGRGIVAATPSRKSDKFMDPFTAASENNNQPKLQFVTPAKPRAALPNQDCVTTTPLPKAATKDDVSTLGAETVVSDDLPASVQSAVGGASQGNIYAALGWDDDTSDDLA